MSLDFVSCTTSSLRQTFERLPETLHGHLPCCVPPFPGSIAKILKPDSVFNTRHGQIHPLLAFRNGKPVGRIAAIVNRSHNTYYGEKTGFFGFFDCIDDESVAASLFEQAGEILRGKGLHSLRGPYNPSINDECGLLVAGNDRPPYIGLTWNPPHYEKLVLSAGFSVAKKSYGFELPLHRLEGPTRLKPIAERFSKRTKARLRPVNMARLKEDMAIVREVYNATLERNWGFVPIDEKDLDSAAEEFRAIAKPEMIMIVEQDGLRAGVALSLPNINLLLVRIKKTPHFLRLLHFLWLLKTTRIPQARQVVYGVSPRFRNRGLHAWLTWEHFHEAKRNYDDAILGWIQEDNTEVLEHAITLGATQTHQWNIYEKFFSGQL